MDDKPIPAAEAKANFPNLLRDVQAGQSYVVIAHGVAVAKISPVSPPGNIAPESRVLPPER